MSNIRWTSCVAFKPQPCSVVYLSYLLY